MAREELVGGWIGGPRRKYSEISQQFRRTYIKTKPPAGKIREKRVGERSRILTTESRYSRMAIG